jgi:hypothetical protein
MLSDTPSLSRQALLCTLGALPHSDKRLEEPILRRVTDSMVLQLRDAYMLLPCVDLC